MLPKPKPCGENWSAMQPADGGRICGKCTKLIRDDSAAALVFSFIGLKAEEVPVSPEATGPFTIRMTTDLTGLTICYVVKPSLPKRVWWKVKRAFVPRRER